MNKSRQTLITALLAKKKNPKAFSGKRIAGRKNDQILNRERRLNAIGLSLTMFDS
jgi:hypothetical protein